MSRKLVIMSRKLIGVIEMDREEILQKAQSKKLNTLDEMELQVIQKGNGIAMVSTLVLCLILMITKIIAKQPWYDVYGIVFASLGVQHLYKGIKLHQRQAVTIGIAYSVLAILIVMWYITKILG